MAYTLDYPIENKTFVRRQRNNDNEKIPPQTTSNAPLMILSYKLIAPDQTICKNNKKPG